MKYFGTILLATQFVCLASAQHSRGNSEGYSSNYNYAQYLGSLARYQREPRIDYNSLINEEAELLKELRQYGKMSQGQHGGGGGGGGYGMTMSGGSQHYQSDQGQYDYGDDYGGQGYYDDMDGKGGYGKPQQRSSGGGYMQQQSQGYGDQEQSDYVYVKKKRIVQVKLPQKEEKKMKIISIDKGFYIPGGTQMFGKFKSLKGCMKACAATPNCFAGDFNPWFGRCYVHSNLTACNTLRAHKKLTHFKKVPCTVPEAPNGLIILGAQLFKGLEQKGAKSLTECLKKCATAGPGIQATYDLIVDQICYGIDYDFGTHKCYFHVSNTVPVGRICSDNNPLLTPRDLVANPSTVFIALCPDVTG